MDAQRTGPPARLGKRGVLEPLTLDALANKLAQLCRRRSAVPEVEDARLVVAIVKGDQAVPEVGAQQGPEGKGHAGHTQFAGSEGAMPGVGRPTDLLPQFVAQVHLGDRNRKAVTLIGLVEDRLEALNAFRPRAHGFDVDEGAFRRAAVLRVELDAVIEPAVACDVVVGADDCRRARVVTEPEYLVLADARLGEDAEERVRAVDQPARADQR